MGSSQETVSSRFEWRQSPQHDTWERDIDECEEFYRSSAKKEVGCFPVTVCAVLATGQRHEAGDSVEAALRTAWGDLRHDHPTLGSRLKVSDACKRRKRVYEPFKDGDEEASWLDATFKVVECDGDALEWFSNNPPPFEISTLFLVRTRPTEDIKTASQQTIFLRCPHDVTDGVGVLYLIHQLLDHAALAFEQNTSQSPTQRTRDWTLEPDRLSPSLRIAARIPEVLSSSHTKRLEEIRAHNGTIYNHPALLSLPASGSPSDNGKTQRVSRIVERSFTSQILSKCKSVAPGISVTHVFMAALAIALAELQPKKDAPYPARYVNHSMINLRPFLSPEYNGPDHAAAPYHTISAQAVSIDVKAGRSTEDESRASELPQLAARVRDFYKTVRPVVGPEVHEQICLAPATFKSFTAPEGSDPHAASDPPFCPVALSSIGNVSSFVASKYGPFEVKSVWAASEPLGAGVALFLGTWGGRLELSAVFDTRFHDAAYVKDFLGRILTCVCKGLGVDVEALASQTGGEKKRAYEADETREDGNEHPARRVNAVPRSPPA